jgi:putative intracellular protease/amidase
MKIVVALASRDFDPSEVAVAWKVLTASRHGVVFATHDGGRARADELMLTGRGLDPWGFVPGLSAVTAVGRVLRANRVAREAYTALERDPAFASPVAFDTLEIEACDALVLPGGHRAAGMRPYLESHSLQAFVAAMFDAGRPVAAICHGVLVAARARSSVTGKSVLHGRRTTALTWSLERKAWTVAKVVRFWDPGYYRTYGEAPGEPAGYRSVQAEVTRALAQPEDFIDVPRDAPHYGLKVDGRHRDTAHDERPAFVVCDGNYVSARWPGDVHTFAKVFAGVLGREPRGAPMYPRPSLA